jgi:hypothetical protein
MLRLLTSLAIGLAILVAPGTAGAAVFSNTSSIVVNGPTGRSSPYPSAIAVSGMGGEVTGVRATLSGINASSAQGLDVLLTGPDARRTLLMSDACEPTPAVIGLTFTFDDAAASALPSIHCTAGSGTFKPTNYGSSPDNMFAPAPSPPFPTSLSIFAGGPANGSWQLWVDNATAEVSDSSIAGGWSLELTTSGAPATSPTPAKKKCKKKKRQRAASAAKKKCKPKHR